MYDLYNSSAEPHTEIIGGGSNFFVFFFTVYYFDKDDDQESKNGNNKRRGNGDKVKRSCRDEKLKRITKKKLQNARRLFIIYGTERLFSGRAIIL